MMAGSDGRAVVGGPARHIPVLARPAVELLNVRDDGVYIDGTFGAGGYTQAILATANATVIGIDRDQNAIAGGAGLVDAAAGRLTLVEALACLLSSGESLLQPMQNGTLTPSITTFPPTGDGGRPSPDTCSYRLDVPLLLAKVWKLKL